MNKTLAQEGYISHAGMRLRYVSWGAPDAPVIVALHGLRSYAYTWEPVAAELKDRYRVIALDQRGRGLSDWDPQCNYYAEAYVGDLAALVEALALSRFVLLGHSMGGASALVYSGRFPEKLAAVVLEDMGPGASAGSQGSDRIKRELLATPPSFDNWADARAFWRRQRASISEAALDSRVLHSLKEDDDGRIVWRHDAAGIAAARLSSTPDQLVDLWPYVRQNSTPMLVVRGGDSDFLSQQTAREMVRVNPGIQLAEIAGASHYVHDDQLDSFNRTLREWLDDLSGKLWAEKSDK